MIVNITHSYLILFYLVEVELFRIERLHESLHVSRLPSMAEPLRIPLRH